MGRVGVNGRAGAGEGGLRVSVSAHGQVRCGCTRVWVAMGVASARGGGGGGSVERKLNMPHSISHSTIGGLRINAGR